MDKKNIVFVLNEYDGLGGAQRVAATLASKFKKDGHHIEIVSVNEAGSSVNYFDKDIPVFHLFGKYRIPAKKSLMALAFNLKLKDLYKQYRGRRKSEKAKERAHAYFSKFDEAYVIVVQVWGMQWLQSIQNENIHVIGQSHESYMAAKETHRYNKLLTYYRYVDRFLLLSQKDKEHFESLYFHNVDVMYNPTPFRSKVPAELNSKIVISTGRLIKEKGFHILIRAFALLAEKHKNWKLHIYGDGPYKKQLNILIKRLNLGEQVKLMGTTTNIQGVIESASLNVLASEAEGLPMSLIEGMSCGLPCIATDCAPGIREIITEYEDGYIVPVGNEVLLSRRMDMLMSNPALLKEFGEKAFENSKKFELERITNQWYELFDAVKKEKAVAKK
ncbi:MAG: glycosyltransferase family 4 protein [Bacillaceae bacterium]